MTGGAMALALAVLPGAGDAETRRGDAATFFDAAAQANAPLHGVAVELAPVDRMRLDAETVAYVGGVAPVAPAAASGPLDRVLTVAGRLPEPASWALMILGFGAVGGAMRRRLRRSDADFTARIRRIAEGDE